MYNFGIRVERVPSNLHLADAPCMLNGRPANTVTRNAEQLRSLHETAPNGAPQVADEPLFFQSGGDGVRRKGSFDCQVGRSFGQPRAFASRLREIQLRSERGDSQSYDSTKTRRLTAGQRTISTLATFCAISTSRRMAPPSRKRS